MTILRIITPADVVARGHDPMDAATRQAAGAIVDDVQRRGMAAVQEHGQRLGDWQVSQPITLDADDLAKAAEKIEPEIIELFKRTRDRVDFFAQAQRQALTSIDVAVPGGRAGHFISPVERAGCYAPAGRYPLPSSVLMTVTTARTAGVQDVWLASPNPNLTMQACAHVAGATGLLCVGGAQAIGALAFGAGPVPPCDVVVGPGNRWVTAAKQWVSGRVGIDMLAGPSELVILADASANPATVAADLIAQAEHDADAFATLVTFEASVVDNVNAALAQALSTLPTAQVARQALARSFAVVAKDLQAAIDVCNVLAPEHLEIMTRDAAQVVPRLQHYGAVFVGQGAAEVFGDYGIGPNHVLPTSLSSRFCAGLNVLTFLRVRTWLSGTPADHVIDDVVQLARLEGLEGHARAALARKKTP